LCKTDNSAKNNFLTILYILTNIKCLVMMPINSSFDVNCMVWCSYYFHVLWSSLILVFLLYRSYELSRSYFWDLQNCYFCLIQRVTSSCTLVILLFSVTLANSWLKHSWTQTLRYLGHSRVIKVSSHVRWPRLLTKGAEL
jgi:hypothetical protein